MNDDKASQGYHRNDWVVYEHPQGLFALSYPPAWKPSTDLEFGACLRLAFPFNQYTYLDVFVWALPSEEENPAQKAALIFTDRLAQAIAKEGAHLFRVRGPFDSPLTGRSGHRLVLENMEPLVLSDDRSVSTTVDLRFYSAVNMVVVLVFEAATEQLDQFRPVMEGVLESLQLPHASVTPSTHSPRQEDGGRTAHAKPAPEHLPESSCESLAEALAKRAMSFYHLARVMNLTGGAIGLLDNLVDLLRQKGGNDQANGGSETGAGTASLGQASSAGKDTPLSTVWYLLPKGRKKEGPLTLDQLRHVVPTSGLRIRRATDSDWCSWAKAVQRYPELASAGILQAAPVASPLQSAENPAAAPSSAPRTRRRKRDSIQDTPTPSPTDHANRISAWKGLYCMAITVAIWFAGAPIARWASNYLDIPVNQLMGWLLAQSLDRPDPALQCQFFAGFWERCVIGAYWGAVIGFFGGLLFGPLGCSLATFESSKNARSPQMPNRAHSGWWPLQSLVLGFAGFLIGPACGLLFAGMMFGFLVNGLIVGLFYVTWGLFSKTHPNELTFSLWGIALLAGGTAHSLFYRQVVTRPGRDILTFRGRFLVLPLLLVGAIGWVSWATIPDHPQLILQGHTGPITKVVFSHDSKLLASASADGSVCMWRMPEGQLAYTLQGHKGSVSCLAFHPTEPWLATGGYDGTVRLWKEGREVRTNGLGRKINALAFHPNGKRLVVHAQTSFLPGEEETALHFLEVSTWTTVISKRFTERWACLSLAFSPDGARLAAAFIFQSSLSVFDGHSGEALPGVQYKGESPQDRSDVNCVVFLDNAAVLLGGTGQRVLWKAPISPGKTKVFCGRPSWYGWPDEGGLQVVDMTLLQSRNLLATAGGAGDNTVRVYHSASGQLVSLFHQPAAVEAVVMGFQNQVLLATGGTDGTVRVWKFSPRLW